MHSDCPVLFNGLTSSVCRYSGCSTHLACVGAALALQPNHFPHRAPALLRFAMRNQTRQSTPHSRGGIVITVPIHLSSRSYCSLTRRAASELQAAS